MITNCSIVLTVTEKAVACSFDGDSCNWEVHSEVTMTTAWTTNHGLGNDQRPGAVFYCCNFYENICTCEYPLTPPYTCTFIVVYNPP